MAKREFSSYTFGEVKTVGGQTVHFTCGTSDREKVAAFLAEHVRDIDVPTTGRMSVSHGDFGRYTRYDVTQHQYAGYSGEDGGGGFIEVLEVKNPPNERSGFIIHDFRSHEGAVFAEWASLTDALTAYGQFWERAHRQHSAWQELGCKRLVSCGALTPWFYAIGDQELIGDYAFPEGLQDDPVYVTGRRFVVCLHKDDVPRIKTCLGTRLLSEMAHDYRSDRRKMHYQRMVHWDDGSATLFEADGNTSNGEWARPLQDGELWVTEALEQFRRLLAGQAERFSIKFSDGTQFVGRVIPAKMPENLTRAGEYYARLMVAGEKKERRGKFDFVPTPELPDAVAFLRSKLALKEIKFLEVRPNLPKGKKWSGVFFGRSKA